jgi:hypothetical protein
MLHRLRGSCHEVTEGAFGSDALAPSGLSGRLPRVAVEDHSRRSSLSVASVPHHLARKSAFILAGS